MKPVISVIVPCYNMSVYLPDCLKSLEHQTIGLDKLQIILVDDASTDEGKTWRLITEFEGCHTDSCVAVHLEENRRQGGAMNAGLQYAEGEYITFVASDDWIDIDMYETMYRYAKQHDCDIVACRMLWENSSRDDTTDDVQEEVYIEYEKSIMEGGTHWVTQFDVAGEASMATRLYRRELFTDTGLSFPEKLRYEDNYLGDIILLYVKSFCFINRRFYHYRPNVESTINKRNQIYHFDRLIIELMKLEKYRELGLMERFPYEIEWWFLVGYYCNTLYTLWMKFDEPPYEIYLKMGETVKKLFPEWKKNPYLKRDSLYGTLLGLIDKDWDREQFLTMQKFIRTGQMPKENWNRDRD